MIVEVLRSIHEADAAEWNALDLRGQPFVRHEFLTALEDTGCATARTGWTAQHLVVREPGTRRLLGAMPLFAKAHSFGEFVFDFSWAQAYDQAFVHSGPSYYPKLVSAIPFTPANGPRLLIHPQADRSGVSDRLRAAIEDLVRDRQLSGAHVLFADTISRDALIEHGWLSRSSCQFHWFNRGYSSMEEFLVAFRADKRKKAKRERRRVTEQGISFKTLGGAELSRAAWDVIFAFSANTFHEHGHEHYLNVACLHRIAQALPERVMVKLAEYRGEPVAAAIFFLSDDTLFGRYWGSHEKFHSLHFEACYYQGIEFCIERGLRCFEPGTQGEHKVPRGFEPTLTYSAHYFREPRFRRAVADYLEREHAAVISYAEEMRSHLPFHRGDHPTP